MPSTTTCASTNLNMNLTGYGSITSTSQILNATSKIDLAPVSGQWVNPIVRVPGTGQDQVIAVAPDFDDTMDFGI